MDAVAPAYGAAPLLLIAGAAVLFGAGARTAPAGGRREDHPQDVDGDEDPARRHRIRDRRHLEGIDMSTRHVVVMGVSGCGKSIVAEGISEATGLPFGEADRCHRPANIAKMESGTPLTDDDRWPWLRELASWMAAQAAEGRSTVIACSALRRAYRDVLRAGPPSLSVVHLDGSKELILKRLSGRKDHFMSPALLDSQFATLEPLEADEDGVVLDIALTPAELVARAIADLGLPLEEPAPEM